MKCDERDIHLPMTYNQLLRLLTDTFWIPKGGQIKSFWIALESDVHSLNT